MDRGRKRCQTAIREIYIKLRRKHLLGKWRNISQIYTQNDVLISEQLSTAKALNWVNRVRERGATVVGGGGETPRSPPVSPPLLAAPVEVPKLYSQMGRFEAKINGRFARVGVSMMPPVSLNQIPLLILILTKQIIS